MKIFTKTSIILLLASITFANINLTMGNFYLEDNNNFISDQSFGAHYQINDNTTFGWEGGYLMVGIDGSNNTTIRLIYSPVVKLGVSYNWWESTGNAWNTNLSTALDFTLIDADNDDEADFRITINLGLDLGL